MPLNPAPSESLTVLVCDEDLACDEDHLSCSETGVETAGSMGLTLPAVGSSGLTLPPAPPS